MFNKLYAHFSDHIVNDQHGFVKERSTQTNLLEYVNNLVKFIANRGQVDTLYTDFSKAFYKVSHSMLLQKLKVYGINGSRFDWFRSYLLDRKQFVVIGNAKSRVSI